MEKLAPVSVLLLHSTEASATTDPVPSDPPVCTIRLGPESTGAGARNRSFNGVEFCEFLGIRYAKPPVGQLRFATSVVGSEDCLFLNIYTPVNETGAQDNGNRSIKFPVLVFIHGGSHVAGSGEVHGVDLLMENDVIVVTLNYRLGVFGFLKNERHNITGNYGLKDQLVALQWIQRYVHHFGGDPERLTVMGHSAGAGDLTHHLYHEQASGLFQGAIILSGSMLAPWAMLYDHEKCIDNYLRELSATTLDELREQPLDEFFVKDPRLRHAFAFSSMIYPCFLPTLEDHPGDGAYFSRTPHEAVRVMTPQPMPILMSETSTEFELMLSHVSDFWMSDNFINNRHPTLKRQIAEILENISKWMVVQGLEESPRKFYRKMANMANLHYPIKRLLHEIVQRADTEQVYYLRFQFDGLFGEYKKKIFAWYVDDTVYGAIHGDELGYIFSPYNLREALSNRTAFRRELSVHIKTVELIANFVKYGNPTPKRSKLTGLVWPAYSESRNQTQYLNIDEEFTLRNVEDRRNIYYMMWQLVYECLYYSQCEAVTQLHQLSESYKGSDQRCNTMIPTISSLFRSGINQRMILGTLVLRIFTPHNHSTAQLALRSMKAI
uniref:Carboxylic ester hydrolase n=1 Tax=Anopheles atroparvus TaxID=41427 RepID=A0A182JN27_ANOAO